MDATLNCVFGGGVDETPTHLFLRNEVCGPRCWVG